MHQRRNRQVIAVFEARLPLLSHPHDSNLVRGPRLRQAAPLHPPIVTLSNANRGLHHQLNLPYPLITATGPASRLLGCCIPLRFGPGQRLPLSR